MSVTSWEWELLLLLLDPELVVAVFGSGFGRSWSLLVVESSRGSGWRTSTADNGCYLLPLGSPLKVVHFSVPRTPLQPLLAVAVAFAVALGVVVRVVESFGDLTM